MAKTSQNNYSATNKYRTSVFYDKSEKKVSKSQLEDVTEIFQQEKKSKKKKTKAKK